MLPVMLRLDGRLVVVVGGGAVGRRKAVAARAAGATVRIIDPRPQSASAEGITVIAEVYRPEHLEGAALVFACAAPEVNAIVGTDAAARGIWVNSATDPGGGDFFLPAVLARGGLTLAVSTGGASPALARRIRDRLETEFDPATAEWVHLLNEVRPQVLAAVTDPSKRRDLLDRLADWPWLDRLRAEGINAVRQAMLEEVQTQGSAER
jgi:precorrin-2 dehydrogenase/sirohydrochlorin ferrochelatase